MKPLLATTLVLGFVTVSSAQLVALRQDLPTAELRSVDPITGTSWPLITIGIGSFDFSSGSFMTDTATARAYLLSSDNRLWTFDLLTGAYRALTLTLPPEVTPILFDPGTAGLVGLAYNHASGLNEFRSINPVTGATTLLNTFPFVGAFVSNPSTDRGYLAGMFDQKLYTFDLHTGVTLSTNSLTTQIWSLYRGTSGLVGLNGKDFYSVDPSTGVATFITTLDYGSGLPYLFTTDPDAGLAYATSTDDRLYTFDLSTGAALGSPQQLAVHLDALQPMGLVPEPSVASLLCGAAFCWLVRRRRAKAVSLLRNPPR